MSQSAVVRDYRVLEVGRRRANRLVLTVAGWGACCSPTISCRPERDPAGAGSKWQPEERSRRSAKNAEVGRPLPADLRGESETLDW